MKTYENILWVVAFVSEVLGIISNIVISNYNAMIWAIAALLWTINSFCNKIEKNEKKLEN